MAGCPPTGVTLTTRPLLVRAAAGQTDVYGWDGEAYVYQKTLK